MKHLFVPDDISLMAKEKNFNEECIAYFKNKELNFSFCTKSVYEVMGNQILPTPTYQQLIDWFSDKHKIEIELKRQDDGYFDILIREYYCGDYVSESGYYQVWSSSESQDRYESYNIAFKEAFKLI